LLISFLFGCYPSLHILPLLTYSLYPRLLYSPGGKTISTKPLQLANLMSYKRIRPE
jgi:hypothetical protein